MWDTRVIYWTRQVRQCATDARLARMYAREAIYSGSSRARYATNSTIQRFPIVGAATLRRGHRYLLARCLLRRHGAGASKQSGHESWLLCVPAWVGGAGVGGVLSLRFYTRHMLGRGREYRLILEVAPRPGPRASSLAGGGALGGAAGALGDANNAQ